ncbi:hypothetical protein HPP92_019553 [Vanilla planifolia]|uniref:Uncharacterized protein n=1 Tax=Vanilla planifolia TaxID=51239 RepID=A0A835Q973_VANPL|nr:hypothetical protein HPP92_019553 [Vanilla planifolia]
MDVFSDSEESCPESSDTDDRDGIGSAYSGNAQGILSSLNESIGKIDDFLAFQRGFAHGDVVYSIVDPSKQFGRVVEVSMVVDLETSMGELIEGVNSRKLVRLCPFSLGDFVVHGSWLGRVSRVFDQVSVLLNNGSICDMIVEDPDDVVPLTPSLFVDDSHLFYYPGQRVSIKHHTPETTKWLCGSWKVGRAEGTVFHVNVGLVNVEWITSLLPLGCTQSPPGHLQDPSMLTLLSCFSHANWQIGDYCLLPKDYDCLYKKSEKESVQPIVTPHFMMIEHLQETEVPKALYSIAKIKIKVDVFWQYGQVSVGLDPQDLHLVSNIGEHDFWPGQFVMEKVTEGDVHRSNVRHLGIVKAVDPQEQIVKVKWFGLKEFVQADWEIREEVVSAYELIEHPDASFSLGDIVIQFPNFDYFEENTPENHITVEQTQENGSIPTTNAFGSSVLQANDSKEKATVPDPANGCTSCVGNVIGFEDEGIEVRWVSGLISKVCILISFSCFKCIR